MTELGGAEPARGNPQPVELDLGDGRSIFVVAHTDHGLREVAATRFSAEDFVASLGEFAQLVSGAVKAASPDRVKLEFGAQVKIAAGKATAMLVDLDGRCDLKVTLDWGAADGG
ncbi:hypothetical protein CLV63_107111 [Murinocardiopsis flavida]|uniref:Trypsin-co-occurring domain-containing protein n=1 Tax=Murinocardiopsis flavida TaxID=645275 RepID=A0A2P8DKJ5_9ACTN|nr:CU044_2847 family protein [Murinocardiopsis flavida]PSK97718.1 hypothetical protein CLV63_107111 [Murinocardiopsis flavida]